MKWLADVYMRWRGWRFLGEVPDIPKLIAVGGPHTSNWDFVLYLAALRQYGIRARYIGKHTLFRWPFGWLFRRWGGIPVDRSKPGGMVQQVAQVIEQTERIILVMAPEGTRGAAPYWKAGFIWIAEATGIPVVLAGIDARAKTVEIGPTLTYEGDLSWFMDQVRAYFADKEGIRPQGKGPVRVEAEDSQPS